MSDIEFRSMNDRKNRRYLDLIKKTDKKMKIDGQFFVKPPVYIGYFLEID